MTGPTSGSRAAIEGGLVPAIRIRGAAITDDLSIRARMERYCVPGAALAVIEDGRIAWTGEYGAVVAGGSAVRPDTLFQAASISKAVAATAVLALVEAGDIDLDADVNSMLRTWRLPDSEHTSDQPVTVRHLLSHTAGLTVPGFPGYAEGEPLPSVTEILDGRTGSHTPEVRSYARPGTVMQYSGGGSTIVQQLVCDVTGRPYADVMHDLVLAPCGMVDSAYDQPIVGARRARAATGHDPRGIAVDGGHHTYPELQAAGLWTTAADLARWLIALQSAVRGDAHGVLTTSTARAMVTAVAPGTFGLGPELGGAGATARFGHSGSNQGFRSLMDALVDGGTGFALLTNAAGGTTLAGEVRRAVADVFGWGHVDGREIDPVEIPAGTLARYAGHYTGPFDLPMRLVHDTATGELYSPAPYGRRHMYPLGPTTFLDEETGAVLEVHQHADHRVERVAVLVDGAEIMAFTPDDTTPEDSR
ncbi:MAG: serine hydrolase domain-containing protein [Ilumatobacteraceae bacterium]